MVSTAGDPDWETRPLMPCHSLDPLVRWLQITQLSLWKGIPKLITSELQKALGGI